MKIKLIAPDPNWDKYSRKNRKSFFPPLSLLMVAAITPQDIEVELVDEAVQNVDFNSSADLVGITCMTASAPRAYQIADQFREKGIKVVLGGIHPTALPEEAALHADAVVVGEAEATWLRLVDDFRSSGELKKFYRCEGFPRLENLPFPRRELLKPNAYVVPNTIQTTRGCPFNCSFCSVSTFFGKTYRTRPIEEVVKEVNLLDSNLVVFVDDNIMGKPSYAKRLFEALVGLKRKWLSQSSLTLLKDESLIKLAAKSGCRALFVGLESLSNVTLKKIGKSFNIVQKYKDAIKKLHDFGIAIIGAIIFGFDEDDEGTFERTMEFVEDAKVDVAQYSILTPLPGTRLYEELENENRIIDRDWSKYTGGWVVFKPKLLSPERLQEKFDWVLRQTYTIKSIFKRLFHLGQDPTITIPMNLAFRRTIKAYLGRIESPLMGR